MTVRLYLVPVETSADGLARGPKYFRWGRDPDPPALMSGVSWSMMPFGFEPTALLAADLTAGQVTTMGGLSDVTKIPSNLDNTLGANLATVQAALEALKIPADMLSSGNTYRQVVRGVIAIFSVAQRFKKLRNLPPSDAGSRLFPAGITFDTTLGDLSQNVRQDLQQAANDLGYDYTGLTLTSSLREVLKKLAAQTAPVEMLGMGI